MGNMLSATGGGRRSYPIASDAKGGPRRPLAFDSPTLSAGIVVDPVRDRGVGAQVRREGFPRFFGLVVVPKDQDAGFDCGVRIRAGSCSHVEENPFGVSRK